MGTRELLIEIKRLPMTERLALLEALARDLREEMQPPATPRASSLERVRGLLQTDAPPPTDEEVQDMIADYLLEKYS